MRSPGDGLHRRGHRRRGLADREHHQARRVRQRLAGEAQARPVARPARAAPRRRHPRPRAPRESSVRAGRGRRRPGSRRGAWPPAARASPVASRSRAPVAIGSSVISIRRFFWRPSGVSFGAIGSYSPCDTRDQPRGVDLALCEEAHDAARARARPAPSSTGSAPRGRRGSAPNRCARAPRCDGGPPSGAAPPCAARSDRPR